LDNWTPASDEEQRHLAAVRTFATEVRRGFLMLLGPVGIGKSHLAVAVARKFQHLLFVKQSTLLRQLRATYSDKKAVDPIERCQEAELLVLDEMGVSGGGKDEWPMLSEILDHRYGHLLPTVVTSNLSWDELRAELGERIGDRLRESAHAVLAFAGESHRPAHRAAYFGTSAEPAEARAMRTFMGQQ
jgi:DNA replication protein DnaC